MKIITRDVVLKLFHAFYVRFCSLIQIYSSVPPPTSEQSEPSVGRLIEIADNPSVRDRVPVKNQQAYPQNPLQQNQFHSTNPFGHNWEQSVDRPAMSAPLRTSTLMPNSSVNATHNSLPRVDHIEKSVQSHSTPGHMSSTHSSRAKQVPIDRQPPKSHHEPKSRTDKPGLQRKKSDARERRNADKIAEEKKRREKALKTQALKRTNDSKHKKVDSPSELTDHIRKPDEYQVSSVRRGSSSSTNSHQVSLIYFMIYYFL